MERIYSEKFGDPKLDQPKGGLARVNIYRNVQHNLCRAHMSWVSGRSPEESDESTKLVLWVHLASCPANGVVLSQHFSQRGSQYLSQRFSQRPGQLVSQSSSQWRSQCFSQQLGQHPSQCTVNGRGNAAGHGKGCE